MSVKKAFVLLSSISLCFGSEPMNKLLSTYKVESELSKITKSESAGFVDTYTREDLQKMQARTLMDIFKLFTIPNVSRTSNNVAFFTKPTNPSMPNSAIRLYINDHDMAASTYGSDAMMWSDMSLEYIDHIVVYKSCSSVEFGNEPGTVIIKLYTKLAEREQGGKVRLMADQKGSNSLSSYYAHTTKKKLSYFFYVNKDDINREKYYNQGYELNSDSKSGNLYANVSYEKWVLELAHYKKENNSFLGLGRSYTPTGGGLSSDHDYIHLSKEFHNDFKLQIAYDQLTFDADYYDSNGIYAGDLGYVQRYDATYKDKVLSLIGEKKFHTQNNKLLIGGFYKQKKSDTQSTFDTHVNDFDNTLDIYSIYAENSYSFDANTMFVASLKFDFYRYSQDVKSQDEYIARVGLIKNINNFQIKAFYTKNYYAIPMAYLYSGNQNTPYKINPDLDYTEPTLTTLGVRYKNENHELDLRAATIKVKNKVFYDPLKGFINVDEKSYEQYELKYTYKIDRANKISFDIYSGANATTLDMSPKYGAHLIAYTTYEKIDFYNEIDFRADYEVYGISVDASYNFTSAIKYHWTQDLSVGLKGENIFDKSFEQAYKGYAESIPVFDQKLWINMEYLF